LTQLRISLMCYDELGTGFLREQDLENYVFEQIPNLVQLAGLEPDFYPYYVFTAVRKFVFFLDPMRKGKIKLTDLMNSRMLREFNELRQQLPISKKGKDWFTSKSALDLYERYLKLDTDQNGMLSKEEFMRYNGGSLTAVFVDRLFQEYRMYRSNETGQMEMDYKTFLDFVLAIENKGSPQALQYFWKIFDVQHCGYLTICSLNFFFREVRRKMMDLGHDPVNVADVVADEIFDMVKPANPLRITLDDLIQCKMGGTVVSILTDVNAFWKYDNRESLLNSNNAHQTQ